MELTRTIKTGKIFIPKRLQTTDDSQFFRSTSMKTKRNALSKSWNPTVSNTQFSCWSPLLNKPMGQQLFKERVELISHWFDFWSDSQRNEFFVQMLSKSNNTQHSFIQKWFNKRVPLQHLDFTRVLPRFLSLYIFSFLDPKSLCRASRVSWYWRFLTEQEDIWMLKCTNRGWYLPYNTHISEYGNWKRHYITCVSTIEYSLRPGKTNQLNDTTHPKEEQLTSFIDIKTTNSQESIYTIRPIWKGPDFKPKDLERSFHAFLYGVEPSIHSSGKDNSSPSYITVYNKWKVKTKQYNHMKRSLDIGETINQYKLLHPEDSTDYRSQMLLSETQSIENFNESRLKHLVEQPWEFNWDLSFYNPLQSTNPDNVQTIEYSRIVLISSRIAGAELLYSAKLPNVQAILYDYDSTTVDSLRLQVQHTLSGKTVKSIGLFCHDEEPGMISLVRGCIVNSKNLHLRPDIKTFFETLSCCVVRSTTKGQFDIFSSLIASENGTELMRELKNLTRLRCSSPSLIVGGFKKALTVWLYENHEAADCSSLNYFSKDKLYCWVQMAKLTEEAIFHCRHNMSLYFENFQRNIVDRLVGETIFDIVGDIPIEINRLVQVLSEALLSKKIPKDEDTVKHVTLFLMNKCGLKQDSHNKNKEDSQENTSDVSPKNTSDINSGDVTFDVGHMRDRFNLGTTNNTLQAAASSDKRKFVASEIINSEVDYVRILSAFKTKFFKPLKSALESNRPIISHQNVRMIFTDILINLKLHRKLCDDLKRRYSEWGGMSACLGDIFIAFCQNLGTYLNLLNNHEAVLRCIERCRENEPNFRAFLSINERNPETKMHNLQEILLMPLERIEEYVYFLALLLTYTALDHPDRPQLFHALCSFKELNSIIRQTKQQRQQERQLRKLHSTIINCPVLTEGTRYFLKQQDVSLLKPLLPTVAVELRVYQCTEALGLYLFNDYLVVTRKVPRQLPLSKACEILYTFEYSLPLAVVRVKNIANTKYVCNAFQLRSPSNKFYCRTESHLEKVQWLSILHQAIRSNHTSL